MKRDTSGTLCVPEKDVDSVSLNSSNSTLSLSVSSRGPQEYVELNVHGIEEAGMLFLFWIVAVQRELLTHFRLN